MVKKTDIRLIGRPGKGGKYDAFQDPDFNQYYQGGGGGGVLVDGSGPSGGDDHDGEGYGGGGGSNNHPSPGVIIFDLI